MLRVVIDPGVLIAALLSPAGAPAKVLLSWRSGAFDLVVSPLLLDELSRVLRRPKFRRYIGEDEVDVYLELFRRSAVLVGDPPATTDLTPDPGDDYLVALARSAKAQALVSGDRHLLGVDRAEPPVLTPRRFIERLGP